MKIKEEEFSQFPRKDIVKNYFLDQVSLVWVTRSELIADLEMKITTVGSILKELVEEGFLDKISRRNEDDNGRPYFYCLSPSRKRKGTRLKQRGRST